MLTKFAIVAVAVWLALTPAFVADKPYARFIAIGIAVGAVVLLRVLFGGYRALRPRKPAARRPSYAPRDYR